jgi:protein-S-isoprenylcysteine O-methyltransferase Ste14
MEGARVHRYAGWLTALEASYIAWLAVEVWIFSRDRRPVVGASADRGSLRAMVWIIAGSIFLAFEAAFGVRGARIAGLQPVGYAAGIAMIWLGIALRVWAVVTLGRFFRVTVVLQDAHSLVTAGPYRWLRHPAYTGSLLTMVGLGVGLGNWLALALLTLGGAIAYGLRIRVEERALAGRFGADWDAYAGARWAVIPFVW